MFFSELINQRPVVRRNVANRPQHHAIAPKSLRKPIPSYPLKTGSNGISGTAEKFKDVEKQTYYFRLFDHFNNIVKYMNQIDRRQTLHCYNEWKNEHPNSFSAYQEAKSIAIDLDSKFADIQKKLDFKK